MKVKRIDVFQPGMPYSGGIYYLSGGHEYPSFDGTFVRITTDCGIEGWGESIPFGTTFIASRALGVWAGIAEMAPRLIDLDPRRVDQINNVMDGVLLGHEHAKAPLDIASRDIFGKSMGLRFASSWGVAPTSAYLVYRLCPYVDQNECGPRHSKKVKGFSVEMSGYRVLDARRIVKEIKDKKRDN